MPRIKQAATALFYGFGSIIVIILLILTIIGPEFVLFPDAMLPMELRELSSAWLAIGFLPMMLASVRFVRLCSLRSRAKIILIYLPAVVCLGALLFWITVWTVGLLLGTMVSCG